MLRIFALIVALVTSARASVCGLESSTVQRMLQLDFIHFDQTDHQGHRQLAELGCFLDAAIVTDAYHIQSAGKLEPWQDRISYFHAGQYFAMADSKLYNIAINRLENSKYPNEPADSEITWNTYVEATEAFFKHDLGSLREKRRLMALKTTGMQLINLKVVDGLINCFNEPYLKAYADATCRE